MLIWILTLALIAGYTAIGYGKGAVRMIFPIIGFFLGVSLASPLAPMVKPLTKTTNPLYTWLVPPGVVFLVVVILFMIIGFVVHRFVDLHFQHKVDAYRRAAFERLNRRLGACLGVIAGGCWAILVGLVVYVLGYPSVQFAGDNDPAYLRYLNRARSDMRASGLEKIAALFDSMPETYFQTADILGIIYNNPSIHSRLANYPAFLSLSERPEFQDLATDTAYQQMLQSKPTILTAINNPKTQGILNNPEIMAQLQTVDLQDLRTYLETGSSPKYEDERILGRWSIDVPSVIIQARKEHPGLVLDAYTYVQLKHFATNFLPGIALVAATENELFVKMHSSIVTNTTVTHRKPAPARPAMVPIPANFRFSGHGTWKGNGEDYELAATDATGRRTKARATIESDRMLIAIEKTPTLVFYRSH